MLDIDGGLGEGGGQVVRSSLALSLVTGRPFRMRRIRTGRDRPGLRLQHLTAVRAAAAVGGAGIQGDEKGSGEITFRPGQLRPGSHRFDVGSAGSAVLVLQTVLPPLLTADAPSSVVVAGGTHNPHAPPFEFLAEAFLPQLRRMGADVEVTLDRPGFHPAGGGRLRAEIRPAAALRRLVLERRGAEVGRRARAVVSALPRHIAERELSIVHALLRLPDEAVEVVEVPDDEAAGPGNAVMVSLEFEAVTGVFTGFGRRGVPAEEVAREACREAEAWLASDVPVGPRLADQLLLPMAVAGGGRFRTVEPTLHTRTQAEVIRRFTGLQVELERTGTGSWRVAVGA